jgi:serine/threonine-protein kinase RsbW
MIIFQKEFPTIKKIKDGIVYSIIQEMNNISGKLLLPLESLRLILDEAIINAMEHGNRWDPEKKITIIIEQTETCLNVIISDEGEGFQFSRDFYQIPQPSINARGRGIHLIKYICSAEWHNNGATINLLIPVECSL